MKRMVVFICLQLIGNGLFAQGGITGQTVHAGELSKDGKLIYDILVQVGKEYPEPIQINGTTRTEARQAELMLPMTKKTLENFYGSEAGYLPAVVKTQKSEKTDAEKVKDITKIIVKARDGGSFVSRHIDGDAIDIQRPAGDKAKTLKAILENRGIKVKDEVDQGRNCLHLSFGGGTKGEGNYEKRRQRAEKSRDEWNRKQEAMTRKDVPADNGSAGNDGRGTAQDAARQKKSREGGVSMKMDVAEESFTEGAAASSDYPGEDVFADETGAVDANAQYPNEVEDNE